MSRSFSSILAYSPKKEKKVNIRLQFVFISSLFSVNFFDVDHFTELCFSVFYALLDVSVFSLEPRR